MRSGARGESLSDLAQRIDVAADWGALPVSADDRARLREIAAQAWHARDVAEPAGRRPRVALVGGDAKSRTRVAAALAHSLGVALYRVDLSQVTGKYVGETEKNFGRLFAEAQASEAVLLFDEGDGLFGERSAAGGGGDRYAAVDPAHLLKLLDASRGCAVVGASGSRLAEAPDSSSFDCVVQIGG